MICKICDIKIKSNPIEVREMMFGLKTCHNYFECPLCETLQIENIPHDLDRYYPENYYSFKKQPVAGIRSTLLRKIKSAYLLYRHHKILGSLLSIGYSVPEYTKWIKYAGVKYDDAILDIGSGSGDILAAYCKAGFTNLQGIDPFLQTEFRSQNGRLKLLRKSIFDTQEPGLFDFIMLNHSFEHMDHPQLIFKRLSELIKPNKYVLIRTPVNKSYASGKYGTNWVDMDPPRHLIVHSVKSINRLAEKNHFRVEKIVFDSTAFQFWGSEQYIRDIPLYSSQSYLVTRENSVFSESEMQKWKNQADDLNKMSEGDQACFYLKRNDYP